MAHQGKWTQRRRRTFLTHLRATGNVTAAAEEAGVSRSSAYALKKADADFRAAWDDAMESALDDLEAELMRRAIEGTEKPVFYGGEPVGSIRSYSDSLAMFLLRSRRPHVFGDGAGREGGGQREDAGKADSVRRRLEEKLAAMEKQGRKADDV